ncbi:unnamed protein product [Pleuronectes platessa]|uniref:Uncharacterized protein n=1 Tax=Pleuronectes platessa TaxID=8262 RepID=A0A9N7YGW9_PLEPL|nr:unnamed protein product [Pleuronectes platessa]
MVYPASQPESAGIDSSPLTTLKDKLPSHNVACNISPSMAVFELAPPSLSTVSGTAAHCSGHCHKLGVKGPLKRLLLNELDSKSQGVVIWVDMQINILHHQPPVGGAWGQGDEVRPILSVI